MQNLFHQIPVGPNPPKKVFCLVEIPKGSTNKYEYDEKLGVFRLDRVLYEAVFFPMEYGIIPRTWNAKDGDPLDIMVLTTFPTFPGCLLACRPIGVLRLVDSGEEDDKIIAVPSDDPRFSKIETLDDIHSHLKKEIKNFWENYAELQPNKKIVVAGWNEPKAAWKMIKEGQKNYELKFSS